MTSSTAALSVSFPAFSGDDNDARLAAMAAEDAARVDTDAALIAAIFAGEATGEFVRFDPTSDAVIIAAMAASDEFEIFDPTDF